MLRRLTLLTALGCGCLALIWGLFWLQGIFVDERDDALAGVEAQRDALRQYARQELKQTLRDQLAESKPTIRKAAEDPLVGASGLYLYEGDTQVLPRIEQTAAGDAIGSPWVIYRNAVRRPLEVNFEAGSPAEERHQVLLKIASSIEDQDRDAIESAVREFLGHRSRFVILSSVDIALTLAMVQVVASHKAHPEFMRSVLRDGFGKDRHMEGLQRALLRKRSGFTQHDFDLLAKDISELSTKANVLHSDFDARVAETPAPALAIDSDIDGGTVVLNGKWYVEPSRGRVMGVRISIPALLDEITAAMRARGLIQSGDEVVGSVRRDRLAIDRVNLDVESERWPATIADVDGRYRLKAGLLIGVAVLAFGIVGMGVTLYRRRQRFLELKSDFVSAVSHELRTPLASMRLMAETIERRTQDVPGVRDYPSRIIRDIDGLSFLIENILSFDRLQRGRWQPKLQAGLRLSEVIAKVDSERDSWSRGRRVELVCERLDVAVIDADPDLLQLVFTNLARNACQYSERDPVRLHVAAMRDSDAWAVRFHDNGSGISDQDRERIFDDFYRAKDHSGRGERGSGLGLSICRKILEAHRGTIAVYETGADGTCFELRFPIAAS